jgi:hypothetical protein
VKRGKRKAEGRRQEAEGKKQNRKEKQCLNA